MMNAVVRYFVCICVATSFLSTSVMAAEPDFFVNFSSCKSLYAPLSLMESPLVVSDGDPVLLACSRQGVRVVCQLTFEGGKQGAKGNAGEYRIDLDAPPMLSMKLVNGNEVIFVNTTEHTAVMSSLILGATYAGSKVCHGLYLTNFEFKNLPKSDNH